MSEAEEITDSYAGVQITDYKKKEDAEKPYAFVSYASNDRDFVFGDVVKPLQERYGLSVYADKAFGETNEYWVKEMKRHIEYKNCKVVLVFVSESYIISHACLLELLKAVLYKNIVFIYIKEYADREKRKKLDGDVNKECLLGNAANEFRTMVRLYKNVKLDNVGELTPLYKVTMSVINQEEQFNLGKIDEDIMVGIFKSCLQAQINYYEVPSATDAKLKEIKERIKKLAPDLIKRDDDSYTKEQFVSDIKKQKPEYRNAESKDKSDDRNISTNTKKEVRTRPASVTGNIKYMLYGKEYIDNQSEMMIHVFEEVLKRHPEMVDQLPEMPGMNCVSHTNYEESANKNSQSMPTYFKICRFLKIGRGICVGTSYGINDKLKKISKLLSYCNEDPSILQSDQVKLAEGKKGLSYENDYSENGTGDDKVTDGSEEPDNGESAGGETDISEGGDITGPVTVTGEKGGDTVERIEGRYPLQEFLNKYNNKTFQTKSCRRISLVGTDECEKYSVRGYESARNMVFDFAMKRIDESGMRYIELVNASWTSKNPIFITTKEHSERKARGESVTYKEVTSGAVSGYSMCSHYSEYDWLRNSLMKQLNALQLPIEKFYLELEGERVENEKETQIIL